MQVMEREESFSSLLPKPTTEYGSFFLRLGTVIAGIGALIYSGIEVGGHLEKELVQDNKCASLLLLAVRPATQVIFILLQTYFLFLNNRMNLYKRKGASRLGLVHLAATNLCIWLKELIHEVAAAADAGGDVTMMEMEVNLEGEEGWRGMEVDGFVKVGGGTGKRKGNCSRDASTAPPPKKAYKSSKDQVTESI